MTKQEAYERGFGQGYRAVKYGQNYTVPEAIAYWKAIVDLKREEYVELQLNTAFWPSFFDGFEKGFMKAKERG